MERVSIFVPYHKVVVILSKMQGKVIMLSYYRVTIAQYLILSLRRSHDGRSVYVG